MAMARRTTPSQHISNKLPTICSVCDSNDCISETTAGSPSSSSASVATDSRDVVDNVAFYMKHDDFGFTINLDTAFNEVNPVSLNDIYSAQGRHRGHRGRHQMVNQHDEQQQPSTVRSTQSQHNVTNSSPGETTSRETSTEPLSILLTSWCIQQSPIAK